MMKYIRLRKAAEIYDFDVRHLRAWCLQGKIPGATKVDKEWRVPVASLEKMMQENAVEEATK